jgi:hypothetical protein
VKFPAPPSEHARPAGSTSAAGMTLPVTSLTMSPGNPTWRHLSPGGSPEVGGVSITPVPSLTGG